MIDVDVRPITGAVTIITGVAAGNVTTRFARRGGAVMATETAAGNVVMVNRGAGKAVCGVAISTVASGVDVVTAFARCSAAVVTAVTAARDC